MNHYCRIHEHSPIGSQFSQWEPSKLLVVKYAPLRSGPDGPSDEAWGSSDHSTGTLDRRQVATRMTLCQSYSHSGHGTENARLQYRGAN